jgi:hypothetical protein
MCKYFKGNFKGILLTFLRKMEHLKTLAHLELISLPTCVSISFLKYVHFETCRQKTEMLVHIIHIYVVCPKSKCTDVLFKCT